MRLRVTYIKGRYDDLRALVQIFTHVRKDAVLQRRCVDFYLGHLEYVNNWDLVDLSCYELLGRWLLERKQDRDRDRSRDRSLLYGLARDGRTIWEQRIGIVSTMQFIRHGQLDDTYAIEKFPPEERSAILKAV